MNLILQEIKIKFGLGAIYKIQEHYILLQQRKKNKLKDNYSEVEFTIKKLLMKKF